jgi:hypothetical protein
MQEMEENAEGIYRIKCSKVVRVLGKPGEAIRPVFLIPIH